VLVVATPAEGRLVDLEVLGRAPTIHLREDRWRGWPAWTAATRPSSRPSGLAAHCADAFGMDSGNERAAVRIGLPATLQTPSMRPAGSRPPDGRTCPAGFDSLTLL